MENKTGSNQASENVKNHHAIETERVPSRRKALKKIAIGGTIAAGASGLPPRWTKPIVDKVLVPAHAQTSPPPDTTAAPTTTSAPTTTQAPSATIDAITFFCAGGVPDIVQTTITVYNVAFYRIDYDNITVPDTDDQIYNHTSTTPTTIPSQGSLNMSVGDVIQVTVTNDQDSQVITSQATATCT